MWGFKSYNFGSKCRQWGLLESNFPLSCASANSCGFLWEFWRGLTIMHACGISPSQRCRGKSGSVPSRMEMKWFLNVWICISATFLLWFLGGTILQLMLLMYVSFCSNWNILLSKRCSLGLNPLLLRWSIIFWWDCRMDSLVMSRRIYMRMALGSYT